MSKRKQEDWEQLLNHHVVKDLIKEKKPKKEVITLRINDTVKHALETLSKNNILSAPVFDEKKKFKGFVDVLDIAGYVLRVWKKNQSKMYLATFEPSKEFFNKKISELINYSKTDEAVIVEEGSSILSVIQTMCSPIRYTKAHRVAVLNSVGEITNIISQSDIVTFAANNVDLIPWKDKTLQDLHLISSCIMMRIDSPFSDALRMLYHNRVSGIALIDEQAKLSANLSASDLRGIHPDAFDIFNGSTLQYLCKGTDTRVEAPITVKPTTTLKEMLQLLSKEKVHRVWITDENDHPRGVVSLSDIMELLQV